MESEALLSLALLGGYSFIHLVYGLRYRAQALNGTRLLFEAAGAGIPFLLLARLLATLPPWPPCLRAWWTAHVLPTPYSATIAASLVMAALASVLINMVIGLWFANNTDEQPVDLSFRSIRRIVAASRRVSLDWAVERYGNSQQKFQHLAATRTADGYLLGVTMANRRIYAGFVVASPDLTPNDGYVELLPVMSGHRDAASLVARYDYVYPVFDEALAEEDENCEVLLTLPIASIQSFHLLDLDDLRSTLAKLTTDPQSEDIGAGTPPLENPPPAESDCATG